VNSTSPVDPESNSELPAEAKPPDGISGVTETDPMQAALFGLPKIIKFDSIARCGEEVWIENEGQIYRLRKTRQGKLILTK